MRRGVAITVTALATAAASSVGAPAVHAATVPEFRVGPAAELFDVVLRQDVPVRRQVTLTNGSPDELLVSFSVVPSVGAPANHARDRIHVATTPTRCASEPPPPGTPMEALSRPDSEFTVPRGRTVPVCVTAILPSAHPHPGTTATHVDFRFDAIAQPTGEQSSAGELAFTGARAPLPLLSLVAALALLTGLGLRPRRRTPRS